jgi:hypothetical protein
LPDDVVCIRMPLILVIALMLGSLRKILHGALFVILATPLISPAAQEVRPIAWKTQWTQALFAQAAREHRFVLLDLHATGATGAMSWTRKPTPTRRSAR